MFILNNLTGTWTIYHVMLPATAIFMWFMTAKGRQNEIRDLSGDEEGIVLLQKTVMEDTEKY